MQLESNQLRLEDQLKIAQEKNKTLLEEADRLGKVKKDQMTRISKLQVERDALAQVEGERCKQLLTLAESNRMNLEAKEGAIKQLDEERAHQAALILIEKEKVFELTANNQRLRKGYKEHLN